MHFSMVPPMNSSRFNEFNRKSNHFCWQTKDIHALFDVPKVSCLSFRVRGRVGGCRKAFVETCSRKVT